MDNETRHMLRSALTGQWDGGDWIVNHPIERAFYRVKVFVCVLLSREYEAVHRYEGRSWYWMYEAAFIPIVSIRGGVQPGTPHGPAVYWAEQLAVGVGYFRNWVYVVNSVSSD